MEKVLKMQSIKIDTLTMQAAELGELNPLPDINTVKYVHSTIDVGKSVPEENRRRLYPREKRKNI